MSIRFPPVPCAQRGLTLIELIIFMVVISVGIAGILSVMNITTKSSADPAVRKQSIVFAEAILEEVLAKEYAPNSGYDTTVSANCDAPERALCDDVNDYTCFNGSTAAKTITGDETFGGAGAISGLAGLSATVGVSDVTINGAQMKRVSVTVTGGAETLPPLVGYRGNY